MSLSHLPRRLFGRSRKIVDPQQHRRRLTMEQFEERVLPATLTVTTLANTDSGGLLSLRQAILDSIDHTNTDSPVTGTGDDTIEFASSLFTSGPSDDHTDDRGQYDDHQQRPRHHRRQLDYNHRSDRDERADDQPIWRRPALFRRERQFPHSGKFNSQQRQSPRGGRIDGTTRRRRRRGPWWGDFE